MRNQQITNEYQQLLDYLTAQEKPKRKPPVKEKKAKKEANSVEIKKLIEESKIHSFVPGQTEIMPASDGFTVRRFESMMRAKLIEEHKKVQSYERPYISVTELIGCVRQSFYVRLRYPVDLTKMYQYPYLYLIQKIGNRIHEVIQELYDFEEIEKTVVSERFKVKGRVDGIRENFIIELKSIDTKKFDNKYQPEHFLQADIYAYILNTEYDYKIRTVTIVYVTRDLKRIVAFDLPYDEKLAEAILSRAPILLSSLKTSQVPDPFGSTKEHCKYCLFKERCKNDKGNEVLPPFMRKKKQKEEPTKENKKDNKKTAFLL
jgi:CRISPR/Cas system-associated exonuclease Cas4 (RecB family)